VWLYTFEMKVLMSDSTCILSDVPVELQTQGHANGTNDSLPGLTQVIESWGSNNTLGGINLPPVRLSVKLSFSTGEEISATAETPRFEVERPETKGAKYSFENSTVPEQPVLVSSSSFIQFS
jgi:hypothetical protein